MKSLRRIGAVVAKELMQIRRDRVTLGMIVMLPLVQLLLFGYAINTDVRHIPTALVDQSHTGLSRVLARTVAATQVVDFTEHSPDIGAAERAIVSGRVRAAFVIPKDVAQRLARSPSIAGGRLATPRATDEETSRPVAQWIVDGSDTAIAGAIKGLRGMPLNELLQQPVNRTTPTFEVAGFRSRYAPEWRSLVERPLTASARAPPGRGRAGPPMEGPGKGRRVGVSEDLRNLGRRHPGVLQQLTGDLPAGLRALLLKGGSGGRQFAIERATVHSEPFRCRAHRAVR